ncbi:TRAP transporter substrate-binding protein [Acidovorax sp. sif1233]|uniref:TRAP transporter substrate-binding protein n=1 Tax=unclassified Acidovorax TaxID=2684926 RepID=UPI001C46BE3B|nr:MULTISPECIES: TRAP transporter substrate-binding protein [unclassified Acidovorax]MBV7430663.1 TRAP transporter substrate-binding protein [Acidovorax sp. sif0732]MBV7449087.1 TRAP transporter substrate-binding protein [Acidovorax sp. sif0715]MBV7457043.1 TRAP transporter substrate-binding protein [Acidovorax sp. sif1233]
MKLLKTLLATALVAASLLPGAHAQERTIKFAFQNQKEHPQAQGAQKFADLVAAKTSGRIAVKLFPGGTLGGDLQTVSALQGGTVEMTVLNAGILSAQAKEFGIYDFPFLFASPQEADAVTDGPFGKKLLDKLAAKNLVGLGYWELGFRNLTNSKRPITKAEDIAGLKIRVIQSPIYIDMFNALGANAVPMPFPELYTAMEQKAVDGQENPFSTILSSKFAEVQKHLTITRHMYNPQAVIVSKKFWDSLNPADQKAVTEAMAEATAFQRSVSRSQADVALEELKKAGMQVTEFSPAEVDKLRAKVKPVVEKHSDKVGAETVQEVYATLAKLRGGK